MAENFVSLYKTNKKSDSSELKLKCGWISGELNILVIDGKTAWSGKFSAEEIKFFCEVLGITRDEYITECQQAFLGADAVGKFSFTVEDNRFVWRKELDSDIRMKFGSIKLFPVPYVQAIEEFVDFAFETVECCRQEVTDVKNKMGYFERERTTLVHRLEEYAQNKEELENILYSKFLYILNAKKERIGILERELSDLRSKLQHNVTETELNKCVVTEQRLKAKPSPKATRETRNTNKKQYEHKVRQSPPSMAIDRESQVLSDTPFENSDTQTTHSSKSKRLRHKQNVRQKGQQRAKTNPLTENISTSCKKEEPVASTSNALVVHAYEQDLLEHSGPSQHQPSKNNTEQHKTLVGRCVSPIASTSTGVLPLENHIPVNYETADQFASDKLGTRIPRQSQTIQKSLPFVKRGEDDLVSEYIKDDAGSVYSSEANNKTPQKASEVICPIDLVSQKINAQSQGLKSVNKITISKNSKKVVTSPVKQCKEFEIISPLDMLVQPKSLTSSVHKNTVCIPENSSLKRPMNSPNMQDNISFEFSAGGTNVCQEAVISSVGKVVINDINTNARSNSAKAMSITMGSVSQTKSHTEVESNHYDSETDVDEPEDACKLSAKHRSVNDIMEDSSQLSLAVSEILQVKSEETHQPKQKNTIENLLTDTQDTDSNSPEIPMAALPKRTRRSERITKSVLAINKSINHFSKLGYLQEKSQNVSQNMCSTLYEQETQIVDTQKLLDELG